MQAIHSPYVGSTSSSSPSKCLTCKLYGFNVGGSHDHDDLPELQSNLRDPLFVNHAAYLLSSVDLDRLSEEAGRRDASSQADAILALQTVLSSVLRSPSFSPTERASILQDTRSSLAEQHHLPMSVLDGILSVPFRPLDGLTPLEFEIQRWSPIWESSVGNGTGMEMIQFLIEHWKPHPFVVDFNPNEQNVGLVREASNPRRELVSLVRSACLRRLNSVSPEDSRTEEDSLNSLYQRMVQQIWSRGVDEENTFPRLRRSLTVIAAHDYNVSVAYSSNPPSKDKAVIDHSSSLLSDCSDDDIDFTAVASITDFPKQLRAFDVQTLSDMSDTNPRTEEELLTGMRERLSVLRQQHGSLRHHPYTRAISENRSQTNEASETLNNSDSTPSPNAARGTSWASPRLLQVEFLAARHSWTLTIGRNELELSIHTQNSESLTKLDGEHENSSQATSDPSTILSVHAEVRLIPPTQGHSSSEDGSPEEHVFTFPLMQIAPCSSAKKEDCHKPPNTVRISPCFSLVERKAGASKPPVSSFDDALLLHGGELLLELRVRIQALHSAPAATDLGPTIALERSTSSTINDATEIDSSSWSAVSVPTKSSSALENISAETSEVFSNPLSTSSSDGTGPSWVRI